MNFLRRFSSKRLFTRDHEWVVVDGKIATIGISDYAQKALGDVVFIELPQVDKTFKKKDNIAAVESVKAASDVYSPVTGKVVEVNSKLESDPSLINKSPHLDGWIAKMQVDSVSEGDLMDEAAYSKFVTKK